jgi:hypothetical protein
MSPEVTEPNSLPSSPTRAENVRETASKVATRDCALLATRVLSGLEALSLRFDLFLVAFRGNNRNAARKEVVARVAVRDFHDVARMPELFRPTAEGSLPWDRLQRGTLCQLLSGTAAPIDPRITEAEAQRKNTNGRGKQEREKDQDRQRKATLGHEPGEDAKATKHVQRSEKGDQVQAKTAQRAKGTELPQERFRPAIPTPAGRRT